MITQKIQLTIKINNKDHFYQCEPDSSLIESLEALNSFSGHMLLQMKEKELSKTCEEHKSNELKEPQQE